MQKYTAPMLIHFTQVMKWDFISKDTIIKSKKNWFYILTDMIQFFKVFFFNYLHFDISFICG